MRSCSAVSSGLDENVKFCACVVEAVSVNSRIVSCSTWCSVFVEFARGCWSKLV